MIEKAAMTGQKSPLQFGEAELGGVCEANSTLTAEGGQRNRQQVCPTNAPEPVRALSEHIRHSLNGRDSGLLCPKRLAAYKKIYRAKATGNYTHLLINLSFL
jgi:hypothetical protein